MRARWLVVVAVGACGRIDFDPAEDLGPFSTPMAIPELSSPFDESDITLTGDELEVYFDSNRPGGQGSDDIWRATRSSRTAAWNAPEPVVELNTVNSDVSPGISLDGLTIYTTRALMGSGNGYDIWVSTRADRGSPWSAPVRVAELSSMDEDTNAQPSANGLSFWMSSTRGPTAERQLWFATRASKTAPWNAPIKVDALDIDPTVYTSDGCPNAADTRLYFVSDRGSTSKQIWVVDRPTPTTFGEPRVLDELKPPVAHNDPWISVDERRLYFAGSGMSSDLFVAERP